MAWNTQRTEFALSGLAACLLMCALVFTFAVPAHAARHALVVGNDNYQQIPRLEKAANDARSIAAALGTLGFQVDTGLNLTRRQMSRKLSALQRRIKPGDEVFFFFAGHGIAIGAENYLLPVDVPQPADGDTGLVRDESHGADAIVRRIQRAGARVAIVVLDACRDNPFAAAGTRSIGASRGLARLEPSTGVFVLFSAGIGQSALDRLPGNDPSPNSVFTRKLVPLLTQPGLSHVSIAKRVQRDVAELASSVSHRQQPAYYDQILGEIVLAPESSRAGVSATTNTTTTTSGGVTTSASLSTTPNLAPATGGFANPLKNQLGEGLPRSVETPPAGASSEVKDMFRRAQAGDLGAIHGIGYRYDFGQGGLTKDEAEAVRWYRRAADGGYAASMYNLGVSYANGQGVAVDEAEAARWYRKAAEAGDEDGMYSLGLLYANGQGVAKDEVKAVEWYRKAAAAGEVNGMHMMAVMFDEGRGGLARDSLQAALWLYKALENGSTFSKEQMATNGETWWVDTRRALQRRLKRAGHYSGKIDGQMGPGTVAAIDAIFGKITQ